MFRSRPVSNQNDLIVYLENLAMHFFSLTIKQSFELFKFRMGFSRKGRKEKNGIRKVF